MGSLFGGAKPPPPPPPVTPPAIVDPEVEAAGDREQRLARLRKGRASTVLTSPLGVPPGTAAAPPKTLLGVG